MLQITEYNIS